MPSFRLPRLASALPFKGLVVLALGAGAATIGTQMVGAQAIAGFNSNAPVNYEADRIELQDKQKRVILSGSVNISQGDLKMNAARTTVAYTDGGAVKIQRIDATGGVVVARGNETARGDVAIYDFNRRLITMVGAVSLHRGADTLNGGRLVIDLASGVSSVDGRSSGGSSATGATGGSSGGRVSGSFTVPKRN
ncbi:OstA family protein [Novosphingobium flavum]|uniref:OstA family protein n=1 Tax=Novosphingobium flavum TaxID=1778672 RepID=A0A7X1KKD6_9SPHN|nr:OstA family protein [Novosphingobium flavum]